MRFPTLLALCASAVAQIAPATSGTLVVPGLDGSVEWLSDEELLNREDELKYFCSVVRVQRAWRERQAVFKLFGHHLFVRTQDAPADYGTLHFPGDNTPSQFLVCSDRTSASLLAACVIARKLLSDMQFTLGWACEKRNPDSKRVSNACVTLLLLISLFSFFENKK